MIVVATHNGQESLDRLLASMLRHGTQGWDVCIVVSNDSTNEYKAYVQSLRRDWGPFKLEVLVEPWGSFESGAFIHAYRELHTVNEFLFLQDSMEVTDNDWIEQFRTRMSQGLCVVPWVTFSPYLLGCTPQVSNIIVQTHGLYREPGFGIFGSIFYTNRRTLEIVDRASYFDFIPKNKAEAEAMERFWALYFNRLNIPMNPIHPNGFQFIRDGGHHPMLRKYFHSKVGSARG